MNRKWLHNGRWLDEPPPDEAELRLRREQGTRLGTPNPLRFGGPDLTAARAAVHKEQQMGIDMKIGQDQHYGMTLDEYQRLSNRTAPMQFSVLDTVEDEDDVTQLTQVMREATFGLGIAGEAGEVADMVKKHLGHGHPVDREKMLKELGDVLWYTAALAALFDITLDEVGRANIEKLKKRYPEGFSEAASQNRSE